MLHPSNPELAYVGALGNTWKESPHRGVYKTTDGGKSWDKVLYVNETTGAGDLVMDPASPNHLMAAMWDHRRWPWFFRSGGAGSGLHVTYDGGESWKRLSPNEGLPEGELGRMGRDFARGNPQVVYAVVEAKRSVMLRSDDRGDTWKVHWGAIAATDLFTVEVVNPFGLVRYHVLFVIDIATRCVCIGGITSDPNGEVDEAGGKKPH